MNDWYDLTNSLDTNVPPLDEVSQVRIEQRVRSALPRRRKRRWLIVAIAAVLVLTACGYAVATGQFSDWFRQIAEDPAEPEASEELLASIGTVIGQSQTVDGVTMTLNGAIWDGNTMLLSLTMTGESIPDYRWVQVRPGDSWLSASEAQIRKTLPQEMPHLTEAEIDEFVRQYLEHRRSTLSYLEIISTQEDEGGSCCLLVKDESRRSRYHSNELVLHLENLAFGETTIAGPFEFTFTVQQKDATVHYTGRTLLAQREDYDIYITGAEVSPFQAKIMYELSVPLSESQYDSEAIHYATAVDRIRVNGEEFSPTSSRGSSQERDENGNVRGSAYTGSFDRIVDPSQVEAIRVGGVWLELDTFTLAPNS